MGADLISTFAWYRTGPLTTKTHTFPDGRTIEWEACPPLLDFDAGRTKARDLAPTWTKEQIDVAVDSRGIHDDVADLAPEGVDPENDLAYDDTEEARMAVLNAMLHDIDQIESIFTGVDKDGTRVIWRDVDQRQFDTGVGFIFSGGMSWGDTPSEAYDHLTNLQDTDYSPGGDQVWEVIGFLPDPYKVIGLVPDTHAFVSDDGLYCSTCQLPRENARHD